eukprot:TRINITY_DN11835_c0_g1_i3.p1 TRINITY_DN11835_c0_g1~~TRINITY_DN11835_c0_g1_i3.p1  ORF type:complete len:144 (+),score=47.52 TRINITY_DN11835_c0_g1_i3:211-642(+)
METHQQRAPELDAGEDLVLGRFENCECLSNSEVTQVLTRKLRAISDDTKDENDPARDLQIKFKEWLERFTHFESAESLGSVRQLLKDRREQYNLTEFETTQLANLCPSTAEEAKYLVKSLQNKIGDQELQQILDEMAAFGKYE